MKFYKTLFYITQIILIIFFTNGYSQSDDKVIPPTPEAASLGEFGSIPMGSYTGSASYSIPLYVVKGKFLEVPVSLNYNSNGIMVEEIAPWTGYGWTLNAGGIINRTVLDLPDESRNFEALPFIQLNQLNQENCQKIENPYYDLQYDEFTFNFIGNSGKFIIVNQEVKIIEALDDYKIELITGGTTSLTINEFVVTDKNGIKYYFGKSYGNYENPRETAIINDTPSPITSWHLTRIQHWSGEIVNFEYVKESQAEYFKNFGETATTVADGEVLCFTCPSPINHPIVYQNYHTKYRPIVFHLSKISATNSYNYDFVEINRSTKTITCRDKKINLNTTGSGERYFLIELLFKSNTDSLFNKYEFEYDHMNEYISIPRNTKSKDWWGYYNGQDNSANNKGYLRGDHNPHPEYAVFGMLKKIIYPTEGNTMIDYEGHSKQFPSSPLTACSNYSEYQIDLCQGEDSPPSSNSLGSICDPVSFYVGPNDKQVTFTLYGHYFPDENPAINGVNVGYAYFTLYGPNNTVVNDLDHYFLSGNQEVTITLTLPPGTYTLGLSVRSSIYFARFKAKFCNDIATTETVYFGGVRVKETRSYGLDAPHNEIRTRYNYNNSGDFLAPNQETIIYNPTYCDGGDPSYSFYTHCDKKQKNSNGYFNSTRTLEGTAFYFNVSESRINKDGQKIDEISHFYNSAPIKTSSQQFITCSRIPNFNPIRYYGSAHEYKTEYYKYIGYNKQLIKTETLNFEKKFDLNGGNHHSYLRESVVAGGENVGISPPANGQMYYPYDKLYQIGYKMNLSRYEIYCFWRQLKSKKIENFFYDEFNNVSSVAENTEYYYTNELTGINSQYPIHHQITKEANYTYSNKRIATSYKYPDDFNANTYGGTLEPYQQQALNYLKKNVQHRIGNPIQIETQLEEGAFNGINSEFVVSNSERISTQRTTYKDWGNSIVLPEYTKLCKGEITTTNPLETRANFTKYNLSAGKLLELKNEENIYSSYIYDHNKKNIIAIIQNATYSEISNILGISTSDLENIAPIGEDSIPSIEGLRTNLPNAMVTTYTYNDDKISSMTDPKGYRTTFYYNIFNQLVYVKDHDGNIIKEYQYNLKSQN